MKILVVYRHYWPDATSYAWILKAVAERLAADGHDVTVYTAQPSYNDLGLAERPRRETVGGVDILRQSLPPEKKTRFWTRLLNMVLFLGGAVLHTLRSPRYDLVLVNTTPAILQGATARFIKLFRGIPYIYNCQDLHPEAGLYGGKFKQGILYRLMARVDKLTVKDAAAAVVLSRDMGDTLQERGLGNRNVSVINNMVIDEAVGADPDLPASLRTRSGVFRVIFAGNLGHFQGLDTIVQAAHRLASHQDIEFLFLGNGLARQALEEQAGPLLDQTVFFHDFVPMDIAYKAIEVADVGLVSLQEKVYKVAYPSKTMMLLNAGCPLLLVVEPESEISSFVEEEKLGAVCPPNDAVGVAEAILAMASSRDWWRGERERIRTVSSRHFGQEIILDKWSDLVNSLLSSRLDGGHEN